MFPVPSGVSTISIMTYTLRYPVMADDFTLMAIPKALASTIAKLQDRAANPVWENALGKQLLCGKCSG